MNQPDDSRSQRIQRFVNDIPRMLAACAYCDRDDTGEHASLIDRLEERVELCDESGRASVSHCQFHYAYWGRDALCGNRAAFCEAMKRNFERPICEIYEIFSLARFGAWHFVPGGERSAAYVEPIDGRSDKEPIEIIYATTTDVSPLRREATVAGWLVEIEGINMLLLGCEIEDRACQKLGVAAARSAWGDAQDFRACDYEADILALLLEPMCVDVGGKGISIGGSSQAPRGGRIFLSPVIRGWGWGLSSMDLPDAVQSLLAEEGLRHREEAIPWHLAVAQAETSGDLKDLMSQLIDVRKKAVTKRLEPRHPIGEHTLETLVSSAELMETVCLTDDGMLDEREDYLQLSLRQLGLECDELCQCGVDPDSPLDETLRRSATLSPRALDALGDAIYLARVRVRWTTVLRCWLDQDSPWKQSPTLVDLLTGIEQLFRHELWHLPIRQLPDPGPNTWRRLQEAIHATGFTGLKVRVSDLFEFADILPELDGIGPKTLSHAAIALAQVLADWPSGPAWVQRKPSISQAS